MRHDWQLFATMDLERVWTRSFYMICDSPRTVGRFVPKEVAIVPLPRTAGSQVFWAPSDPTGGHRAMLVGEDDDDDEHSTAPSDAGEGADDADPHNSSSSSSGTEAGPVCLVDEPPMISAHTHEGQRPGSGRNGPANRRLQKMLGARTRSL